MVKQGGHMEFKNSGNQSEAESPMTVSMFLAFVNKHGRVISREWLYRQLKNNNLPHLRIGKKVMVLPSQIFGAMQRGEQ
jgi:hypothetical protein